VADVFISYAAEDRERARTLAVALQAHGWSIWWDRKIVTGQTFDAAIERELETARAVVVLWSSASIDSEWVRNEAAVGAERGVLVPALIEAVKLPLEFRRKQTADLTGWDGSDSHEGFQSTCSAIAAHIATATAPSLTPISSSGAGLRTQDYRKRVLLSVAVASIALAVYWGMERLRGTPRQLAGSEASNAALIEAARKGQVATLRDLLDRGADLRNAGAQGLRAAADARYWGPQSNVEQKQQLETLTLLLRRGVDVNGSNEEGLTALMLATRGEPDPVAAVKTLLEHGADIHARCNCSQCDPRSGSQGCTALMIAASKGHRDCVRLLLERGAKVDQATDANRTALMLTTDTQVVRALLEKGADVNLRDAEGMTALMYAIRDPRAGTDAVDALLNGGARIDTQDGSGRTALTWAAIGGRADVVRALLNKHAALNPKTNTGRTPLALAAVNGRTEVVRELTQAGARLDEKDSTGKTALELAQEQLKGETRDEIVHLLRAAPHARR